jgi:signal transduction histidine kinase
MDKLSKEISLSSGVTAIIIITLFLLVVGIGIIMLVLLYQKKQLQYLKDKEQLNGKHEKEILESKLEIQEQTLKNISQEIHDNIGQVLTLVKINLSLMNCEEPKPLLQERIRSSSELIGKAIQDLRDLSKALNSDTIAEMDFIKAIEYELDLIKKAGGYTTFLTVDGELLDVPGQKKLILFRILQEVLNNIIKHANAVTVKVLASYHQNGLVLQISDDGKGFDISKKMEVGGLGIKNMKNRSQLIGAVFDINSRPGEGTMVKVDLPL